MKLYLEVTQDKLSLPLGVAESVTELARIRGLSKYTIFNHIRLVEQGILKNKYPRFIVVEVDDEE